MKSISLRFDARPLDGLLGHATHGWARLGAAASLTLAVGLLSWAAFRYADLHAHVEAAASASALRDRRAKTSVATVAPSVSPAKAAAFDRMTRHLNTPWSAVLDAIEQQSGPQVALLSMEPDALQGRVRVELEARELPPLLDFARRMAASPSFDRVDFVRHERVEQSPGTPYRMQLDIVLPAAAGGREGVSR